MPTLVLFCLTTLASLTLPSPATPQDPGRSPDRIFADDLADVHSLMEHQRWKKAREQLLELIEDHRESRLLRTRWFELENALTQANFWSTQDIPEPKDVIEGQLLSYSKSSGKIKIKYSSKKDFQPPWDFDVEDDFWVHPVPFAGPYKLTVKGTLKRGENAVLVACYDGYEGSAYVGVLDPNDGAALVRVEEGEGETLEFSSDDVRPDRSFEVDVRDGKVSIRNNNKVVLSTKKPKDLWGRVGFFGFDDVDSCEILGEVEPSWIEGRVDALLQEARSEFEDDFDVMEAIPDWLVEALGTYEEDNLLTAPGEPQRTTSIHLGNAADFMDDADELLEYANRPHEMAPELREWLRALAHNARGDYELARSSADAVVEADADFYLAHQLLARLDLYESFDEVGMASLEALVEAWPDKESAYSLLAEGYLWLGDHDEAESVIIDAIERGMSPLAFRDIEDLRTRAELGPNWGETYEKRTKNYAIRSDLDERICFEASEILEESYRKWNIHLRRVETPPDFRYRVFLFSGPGGYMDYGGDVLGSAPENTAGVFSPLLKQLLIWNLPEREDMYRTIRHEGFHQYFDALVHGNAPRWLNEGLAEYYETTELVRGRWKDGALIEDHVDYLRRKRPMPLRELLTMGASDFYKDPALTYGQSWAFCHFLMHADKDHRKALDRYLDRLIEGVDPVEALSELGEIEDLDGPFASYVREFGR